MNKTVIHLFTDLETARLRFTMEYIFLNRLDCSDVLFYTDPVQFSEIKQKVKLNYSTIQLEDIHSIFNQGLLMKDNIEPLDPDTIQFNGFCVGFPSPTKTNHLLPFDVFSFIFYLISRYEEYLPAEKDNHDRFCANSSHAYKNNYLQIPIVDVLIKELQHLFNEKFELHLSRNHKFCVKASFDIDFAYAYLYKGIFRNLRSTLKSISDLDVRNLITQFKVLIKKKKDPFDNYSYMIKQCESVCKEILFFWLLGKYNLYDKNHASDNAAQIKLIKDINAAHTIGIHPSYQAHLNPEKTADEILTLEKIIDKKVNITRQHFLRLSLPESYQLLIRQGIAEDYTMGYPDAIGFRAGTSLPFYWFDLANNQSTKLKIVPFSVMDVTLNQYLSLNIENSIKHIKQIIDEIIQVDGHFVFIWHNSSLSDVDPWKGWRKVFEAMLELASKHIK